MSNYSFGKKSGLMIGACLLLSACGTGEARQLVSDMRAASASAEVAARQVTVQETKRAAAESQTRAALNDLYASYVKAERRKAVDAICSQFKADAQAGLVKAVTDAQTDATQAGTDLVQKVNEGVQSLKDQQEIQHQKLLALQQKATKYSGDDGAKVELQAAVSAYASTSYVIEAIVRSGIEAGYAGINSRLRDFTSQATKAVETQVATMEQACTAARTRIETDAVPSLDLGDAPAAGNGGALFLSYAENMGKASDALDNYFNTNFSLGKGSFFGAFGQGLLGGVISGTGKPVTLGDIAAQGKSLVDGALGELKSTGDGLTRQLKDQLGSLKGQLVSDLTAKAQAALEKAKQRLSGGKQS